MRRPLRPGARGGFTLLEVLAVLFLTALVLGVALNFFIDLSNQSAMATESTRELRRATSLLDRIARDLERTLLVRKEKDADPLAHPWIFLAEPHLSETGADRLKFMLRTDPPRTQEGPASDLATVAYTLERSDEGPGFALHRWSSSQLPERLDRSFPAPDDPASLQVADGVAHFAVRFLGETGEWVDRWDSSQLVESSELPFVVEVELALLPSDPEAEPAAEPVLYTRRVLLPMRPLDLVALLDPDQAAGDANGEDGKDGKDGKCKYSVADCLDWSMVGGGAGASEGGAGLPPGLNAGDLSALGDLIANAPNICWDDYRAAYGSHPAVREFCR